MNNLRLKFLITAGLVLSSVVTLPAYSEEAKVIENAQNDATNSKEDDKLTPEQKERLNFVSKYDVNLNSDNNYLFDVPTSAITFTIDSANKAMVLVNDLLVDAKRLGKTQVDKKTGKTTFTYYGVELKEGKNIIKTIVSDNTGTVVENLLKEVYVKGNPDKVTIERIRIPADGKSAGTLIIDVKDKWGNPVVDGTFVTIKLEQGQIKSEDANPKMQGNQVITKDGKAKLIIVSSNTVETYKVQALAGDVIGSDYIDFVTPLRDPVFIALAKNRSSYSFVNGTTFANDPRALQGFNNIFGLSGFTQGSIFNDYLLTASFNTQRRLNALDDDQNILLRDRAEDRTYPIYGDSSQLNQIAVSNSNVYFKLEKDKSSFLWGDYATGANSIDSQMPIMSNYNRVLTGARLGLNLPGITNVELFGAMANQVFDRDEIRGAGVSGPYYTTKFPLVNGAERIMIETRDRQRPNVVLLTKTLNRLSDYNIDYTNGTVTFSQPVATFDQSLNPNYIVITYEYYPTFINSPAAPIGNIINNQLTNPTAPATTGNFFDNTLNNAVVGARINQPLNVLGAFVGGSYIRELSLSTPYQLVGANIGNKIDDKMDFIAEYANSFFENKYGSSYRLALNTKPFERFGLNGEYQLVDQNFVNRSGSSFTQGSERYMLRGNYKPFDTTDLNLEYNRNNIFASKQLLQTVTGNIRQDIFSHNITVGAEGRNFPDPKNNNNYLTAGLINIGYRSPTFYNISLNASREQNFLGAVDQLRPTTTSIGADYALNDNTKLFIKQNFLERDKLITATAIGVDTGFSRESSFLSAVNVGAKYQIDGAIDGRAGQTRIGLNNRINVLPELALGLGYERVNGTSQVINISDDHNAWSVSADYTPNYLGLRASAKYDMRDGVRGTQLYSFNAAGALGDDFSLLGRFNYNTSAELARRSTTEGTMGIAYRPLSHDYFNALLKYQIRQSNLGINQISDVFSNLVSFEGYVQPSYMWELYTKFALKNSTDKTAGFDPVNSNITLGIARLTHKFLYNFDAVAEYRNLAQIETATMDNQISAELGYYPMKDLRIGLGYNFIYYMDSQKRNDLLIRSTDLLNQNQVNQGPYINLSMKLDSLGSWWGQQGVFSKKDMKAEQAATIPSK